MKTFIKLLFVIGVLFVAAPIIENADIVLTAVTVFITTATVTGLVVPYKYINSGHLGVLDLTVWKKYIIEKLRKNNAFIFKSKDDTRYVLGGITVVIPQAGADPTIIVNNTVWPLVPVPRTDTDVTYNLDLFSTTPHYVTWAEIQSISYQKWDSIIGTHVNAMIEKVADSMLIKWSPTTAGAQVATTGGPTALTQAAAAGQTGTRKLFHPKDLLKAMAAFNLQNIPDSGRYAVVDANMYEGFYDALTDSQANAYNQFADNKTGQVGKLHSFNIFVRSTSLLYAAAATSAKALGSAVAATDNLASLCWHEDMVCRAVGEMKPFAHKDDPTYQGDIFSMANRFGGRKERSDNAGVIAIVQAA